MRIPRNTLLYLYAVLVIKLISIAISAISHAAGWIWVPKSSNAVVGVALAFVLSSMVFLTIKPKLGLASTATFGALTFYGAMSSFITGHYLAWSAIAALTSLALVGLTILGLRQINTPHYLTKDE
ncbi:hypothetical protein [Canibacter zhoujuaniae]|uniref:hypothetical protein n=1 Tax=Canibacter zhoujuaniae TaxID=2708343 RepID=UPI001422A77E|nr:hypothetical protein [Canibacter zhoujuaniae]